MAVRFALLFARIRALVWDTVVCRPPCHPISASQTSMSSQSILGRSRAVSTGSDASIASLATPHPGAPQSGAHLDRFDMIYYPTPGDSLHPGPYRTDPKRAMIRSFSIEKMEHEEDFWSARSPLSHASSRFAKASTLTTSTDETKSTTGTWLFSRRWQQESRVGEMRWQWQTRNCSGALGTSKNFEENSRAWR